MIVMGIRSAEMTKYAANCMLATKISFMNEVANICETVGADVKEVRAGIGSDRRIGYSFIYPGVGYGGSCFPKDVRALINTAKEHGCTPSLVEAVDAVNNRQKGMLAEKIKRYFKEKGGTEGKILAMWGLAFKANTDDMRESAALDIIRTLTEAGMTVRVYDPVAGDNGRRILKDNASVAVMDNQYDPIDSADALAVVTDWNQFRNPDFNRLKRTLKEPVVFDGRNLFSRSFMKEMGFSYISVGRQPVIAGGYGNFE
jgi:UDPglucose 6-dehydrogenase